MAVKSSVPKHLSYWAFMSSRLSSATHCGLTYSEYNEVEAAVEGIVNILLDGCFNKKQGCINFCNYFCANRKFYCEKLLEYFHEQYYQP
jgi:hypothetical protein